MTYIRPVVCHGPISGVNKITKRSLTLTYFFLLLR